ncbi:MAG: nuclear transport factor 2 family protein [Calditrichaeota bacterium]|nr:nuclear transport factor 2 family protein [Calditrichota bacterium]
MKTHITNLKIILLFTLVLLGTSFAAESKDQIKIKKLITEAYIEGLMNWGDPEQTKKGFDPTFNLLIIGKNDVLRRYSISDWIENVSRKKKKFPQGPKQKTVVNFVFVDVTGNAAVAKIELFTAGSLIYTDYLSLYRFKSGWRIVSKIYQQHK